MEQIWSFLFSWTRDGALSIPELAIFVAELYLGLWIVSELAKFLYRSFWRFLLYLYRHKYPGFTVSGFRSIVIIHHFIMWDNFRRYFPFRFHKFFYRIFDSLINIFVLESLESYRYRYAKYVNLLLFRARLDLSGEKHGKPFAFKVESLDHHGDFMVLNCRETGYSKEVLTRYVTRVLVEYMGASPSSIHIQNISRHEVKVIYINR